MNIKEVREKKAIRTEKVLQIGEGNFLRAFADWMIDRANERAVFDGSIVLCQPIERGMADQINAQDGMYTVLMRGIVQGEIVERAEVVSSVSRCINPYTDDEALLHVARSPELRIIISNTTEAGIIYRPEDQMGDRPPASYPAKLTVLLYERYKTFQQQTGKGLLILPVELIEKNGEQLRDCVLNYAESWQLGEDFIAWLERENCFASTLVDRIVTGFPANEAQQIAEQLGYEDPLLVTCEPFHLWVIEAPQRWASVLPLQEAGIRVIWTEDMTPYRTRKVRILNGAHTVSALAAFLSGHDIVLQMMQDARFQQYLTTCIWQEIIPTIQLPKQEMDDFANAVLERFANPFIQHRLLDISLNSISKYKARCLPSLLDYMQLTGQLPEYLTFGLAALLVFYRGVMQNGCYQGSRGNSLYEIRDDATVLAFFAQAWKLPHTVVKEALSNEMLWGQDLTSIEGLCSLVEKWVDTILQKGMTEAIKELTGRSGSESFYSNRTVR